MSHRILHDRTVAEFSIAFAREDACCKEVHQPRPGTGDSLASYKFSRCLHEDEDRGGKQSSDPRPTMCRNAHACQACIIPMSTRTTHSRLFFLQSAAWRSLQCAQEGSGGIPNVKFHPVCLFGDARLHWSQGEVPSPIPRIEALN